MAAGRPQDYPTDEVDEQKLCDQMIDLFSQGMSKTEVASNIGVARSTFYEWEKNHPRFSDAIKLGLAESQAWWEKTCRENLISHKDTGSLNTAAWIFNMKNRFRDDWKDTQEIEQTVTHLDAPDFSERE